MLIIYIHAQKSTTKFFVLGILGILTIAPYVRVVTDISKMNFSQGSVVFAAAKSIDRRSVTLTSLPFHQAFAGYNAFVVDRLPAQSTSDKSRYWPANRERLKRILQTANVLVLDNTDMARIRPLTARAFNCTQSRGVNICIGPN
ncbi:hypothetical protein EZJ19_09545 [Parasulfuritortus cantonensis]|uniref:Uncharacterized protein n=1 Tax=Parasulfuritortus cantonensis TaxID=2528202 RepID=A0A4R1BCB3_9PROT|nr:hypothetical protein [Parasulfuritortus cantonensis]TCJ14680.1 hypothetical protein EZJ19_09545 [Parasulfuritortus cantonensis]